MSPAGCTAKFSPCQQNCFKNVYVALGWGTPAPPGYAQEQPQIIVNQIWQMDDGKGETAPLVPLTLGENVGMWSVAADCSTPALQPQNKRC